MGQLLPKVSAHEADRRDAMNRAELELLSLINNSELSDIEWIILLNKIGGSILRSELSRKYRMSNGESVEAEGYLEEIEILTSRWEFWDQKQTCDPLLFMSRLCGSYREKYGKHPFSIGVYPQTFQLIMSADSTSQRLVNHGTFNRAAKAWDIPPICQNKDIPAHKVIVRGQDGAIAASCLKIK